MDGRLGFLFVLLHRRYKGELSIRHGYLVVVAMWTAMPPWPRLVVSLAGSTDCRSPMRISRPCPGITTTGATGTHRAGQSAALPSTSWRARAETGWAAWVSSWCSAILPLLGPFGAGNCCKAETAGTDEGIRADPAHHRRTRATFGCVCGIHAACIVSLKLAGMNWLDAICHAFAAMGSGAVFPHSDASVGYFNSPAIECDDAVIHRCWRQ